MIDLEKHKASTRRYMKSAKGKAAVAAANSRYRKTPKGKAVIKRYKKSFPGKIKARAVINNGKRDGRIKPQPCANCGRKKTQAHHPDYRRPLLVEWLCNKCHVKAHTA